MEHKGALAYGALAPPLALVAVGAAMVCVGPGKGDPVAVGATGVALVVCLQVTIHCFVDVLLNCSELLQVTVTLSPGCIATV